MKFLFFKEILIVKCNLPNYPLQYSYLYALNSDSMGLADSPWPKFRHDNQNTGRVTTDYPDIAVTPDFHDYGSVTVGEHADKTFVVKNEGTALLSVSSTTLVGADASEFSIQSGGGSFDLNPGETRNVVVRFEPQSAGDKNVELCIDSNDPDEPHFCVPLSGTGVISPAEGDVITLDDAEGMPGDEVRIPLYIQDVSGTPLDADDPGNEVAAWTIQFSADNEYYQITGVERAGITAGLEPNLEQFHNGNNTWTVIYNTSAGNPPPVFTLDEPAPGDLIGELVITLSDEAEGDLLVEMSDATLSNEAGTVGEYLADETLGVVAGTIHISPLYGDVTDDGNVTALDAAVVLQACVGFVTLTPEQEERANVSGENGVTAYDAALIMQYVVGLLAEFPVDGGLAAPALTGRTYTISVGKICTKANERIVVPISVDDASGILSGKFSLTYDVAYLNPIGVRVRNQVFGKNSVSKYNVRDGVLEISFADAEELKAETGQDGNHPLLFVEFETRKTSTSTIPLTLSEAYLNEGLNVRKVDGWVKFTPETTALLPNFPNPFNPDTWIPYQLTESASVVIRIYNVSGQLVRRLDTGHRQAGFYIDKMDAAYWDGRNEPGERVASGVYFYQLEAGKFSTVRKMTIIK